MMQIMSALLLLLLRLPGKWSNMVAHMTALGWDVFAVHVSTQMSALIVKMFCPLLGCRRHFFVLRE